MKKTFFLLIYLFLSSCLFSQCKSLSYSSSQKEEYTANDTLKFEAINKCKKNKQVVFSLEFLESSGEWQLEDFDIFVIPLKGMKIITLLPMKKQKFIFNTKEIDPVFFEKEEKVRFRIVSNLYSADKVQIIETKVVKEFLVHR